ncbi:trihelix transcription factor ENAP2 [Magnolia sinica]|uniref:trihelix transcription factor ENAP2 n=1 Tax=Magnolia sinica TaxID=86752 RepID=UPI002659EBDB|nr:trihelix transcription factor ENAP2 [Magnolia sinica]
MLLKCRKWGEMEKTTTPQNNPCLLTNEGPNDHNSNNNEDSLKKPLGIGSGDRLKRDEWSEGAVSSLLDAYESKWVLRNRAKLKGHDWEDVARHVSSRAHSTKSSKTQTQCKNKIESMKKRYRSESTVADPSSWPLFQRLDLLLRCRAPPPPPATPGTRQDSPAVNGVEVVAEEDRTGGKMNDGPDKMAVETDSSTPICDNDKWRTMNMKRKKVWTEECLAVADSVQWLAEVVVRSERARMETMREVERIRREAETRKGEMDLKRTEIITNTQLEITRLLVGKDGDGSVVQSSLRIGRIN